ncbi:MAG: FKBP-type peptidyl-prolyl cis-trans isomerase [Gammaproteobacteria bacterium]|nr:FKBP-type peptidyl-prolyl cis-trans isomerase [Gammaproteobacteria bacterium]
MRMRTILIVFIGLGLLFFGYYMTKKPSIKVLPEGTTDMQDTDINKAKGAAFLEENKNKDGVVTLDDGLQYKIIVDGNGEKPGLNDTVEVHYAGTLIDGTEFDSSYKRKSSISFPLKAVIPGWTEALQLMPVGSTWELYIPSNLAYGSNGAPPVIGPNETLIFKVELLGIKK